MLISKIYTSLYKKCYLTFAINQDVPDKLEILCGLNIFTVIDLKSDYHQVKKNRVVNIK